MSPAKLLLEERGTPFPSGQLFPGDPSSMALICSPHTPHAREGASLLAVLKASGSLTYSEAEDYCI